MYVTVELVTWQLNKHWRNNQHMQTYWQLFWPTPATFEHKLYGDVNNLNMTVAFFKQNQTDIWVCTKKNIVLVIEKEEFTQKLLYLCQYLYDFLLSSVSSKDLFLFKYLLSHLISANQCQHLNLILGNIYCWANKLLTN